jgi:hypothetical protein
MATNESFAFPLFSKGQVLKSEDLNSIPQYVDEQDRLTRSLLIGAGVLQGLEMDWQGTQITVTKGTGVSSKGYLFYLPEPLTFTHYDVATLSSKQLSEFLPEWAFPAWKLSKDGKNPLPDSDATEMQCRCLLALRDLKFNGNVGSGCYNGFGAPSKNVGVVTDFYLVGKDLLESLPKPPVTIDKKVVLNDLPVLWLQRLGLDNARLDLTQITDLSAFKKAYEKVCSVGIADIAKAFLVLETNKGKDLDPTSELVFGNLTETLGKLLTSCLTDSGYRLPYFYELLEDLVKAYQELFSLGDILLPAESGIVEEDWFPKFLLLGGVGDCQAQCRTPRYCAPGCGQMPNERLLKARFLYSRLHALLKNASFEDLPKVLKITPGKGYAEPLSKRAIPFFYKKEVRPTWSFELFRQEKSWLIPSYTPGKSEPPYDDPLLYELESWGFFRVEGHANTPLQDAIAKIEAERSRVNVSFDIVCVPLSEATRKLMPDTVFDDLESAFHQLRLEWILGLQLGANRLDLKKFLEEMEGTHLHQLDILRLEQLATATQQEEDVCKYDVARHLYETWTNRVTPPLFSKFAEHHPGLEHLGGVQPGGTLVLVYDNLMVMPDGPFIEGEKKAASRVIPQVVLADFCLPYLCCNQPKPTKLTEIFACFSPKKLCFDDEPKEIFTWPTGGRILVSANDKPIPNAAVISTANGKWHFVPSRLPADVYSPQGIADVSLRFLNSGKTIVVQSVRVSRITVGFRLSAFQVISPNQSAEGIQIVVDEIVPETAKSYRWSLVWLKGEDQLGDTITLPELDTNKRPWQTPIVMNETPTQVRVELIVFSEHGCSASFEQTAFIAFSRPMDETGGKTKSKGGNGGNDKPTDKSGKGDSSKQKDKPNDTNSGNPISDMAHLFDVQEVLNRRLNQYKKQFTALRSEGGGANNIVWLRASFFFFLSPDKETTPLRYQECSDLLLGDFEILDPREQDRRRLLLEVLTHCYLDNLFAFGQRHFDINSLPNWKVLEQNGIDVNLLFKHWQMEELGARFTTPSPGRVASR